MPSDASQGTEARRFRLIFDQQRRAVLAAVRMVSLVRAELHLMDAALAGDEALADALGHAVVPGWVTFTEALGPTREAIVADPNGFGMGHSLLRRGGPARAGRLGRLQGPAPRRGRRARIRDRREPVGPWPRHRGHAGDARRGVRA